jgi:hypothetical protein
MGGRLRTTEGVERVMIFVVEIFMYKQGCYYLTLVAHLYVGIQVDRKVSGRSELPAFIKR